MTTTFHHVCRLLPRLILCGLIAAAACRALAQPPRSETARDWRRHAAANAAFDADGTPREAMPMHDEMSDAVFMGCPILAQAARLTVEARYADACLRHMRFIQ